MALFKRKQSATGIPELEWYQDAEKRERAGQAWLLATISVIGVVLILIGLFFGGRWVYREINKNKKNTAGITQTTTTKTAITKQTTSTPVTTPAPSTAETHTANTNPSTVTKTNPPATAPTGLANTGPSNTVGIFVVVTILGALAYQLKLRKLI